MSDNIKHVEALIKLAAESKNSLEAMQYSQAACNAANAAALVRKVLNASPT